MTGVHTLHNVNRDLVHAGVGGTAGVGPGLVGPGEDEGEETEGGGARPPLHCLDVPLQLASQVQQLEHQKSVLTAPR